LPSLASFPRQVCFTGTYVQGDMQETDLLGEPSSPNPDGVARVRPWRTAE
jgi:hypothetical protein